MIFNSFAKSHSEVNSEVIPSNLHLNIRNLRVMCLLFFGGRSKKLKLDTVRCSISVSCCLQFPELSTKNSRTSLFFFRKLSWQKLSLWNYFKKQVVVSSYVICCRLLFIKNFQFYYTTITWFKEEIQLISKRKRKRSLK